MGFFHDNALVGASGAGGAGEFKIERSLRFNSADSASLSLGSYSGSGTFSCWVKRCKLGSAQTIITNVAFAADDTLNGSTAVFRDPSAWMHIVVSSGGTYVNGTSVGSGSAVTPSAIGSGCDLYLAEVHFIDGQALAATDFGEYDDNNVWQPKAYAGTYGTNGFHLDFSDSTSTTTIGEDSSGNNNDWTANNISVTAGADNDSLIDTPLDYEASSGNNGGNYCILNSLDTSGTSSVSDGGLEASVAAGATNVVSGNFHVTSGKWYWEASITSAAVTCMIGVADGSQPPVERRWESEGWYYYASNGNKYHDGGSASYGSSYGQNDIIGIALDMDAGTLTFYKNGTTQGVAYSTGLSGLPIVPTVNNGGGSNTHTVVFNFGQRPFAYTPPTGHLALVTTNLSDPTIADSSTAMDAKLYTGNGSTQSISGLNFAPDLVWIKNRSQADLHVLTDTVRGATKQLSTSSNVGETTNADGLTAFNSDGFDLGADVAYNTNTESYVAWTWDGGTSTVTNTDGTHTSQVRANPSTGLSISTHSRTTAASISTWGHGLGAAPEFAILKPTNISGQWFAWHKDAGNNRRFYISSGSVGNTYGFDVWSSDSTTLGIYGTIIAGGGTALDCLTYAWTPIENYSRFGFYEGTANANGQFVFTGFTPKLVMTKGIDAASNWNMYDTSRDTYNVADAKLSSNLSSAESTLAAIDMLSNGFKIRTANSDINGNAGTFIYCAWAENPFKNARAK